jgi:hypothetical protein
VTFRELLADVVARLSDADVPYILTGSLASSYHGEPRATRDIDVVIDPDLRGLLRLVDGLLDGGFDVDRDAAVSSFTDRTQFNAIARDASKVDFMIRKDRPFSRQEFARRERADLLGTEGYVATAEDLLLAKLEWARLSDSERQVRDVAGIVAVTTELDMVDVDRWAQDLGVSDLW